MIEVLISIAILAILAGIAAPSFKTMIQRHKVAAVADDMVSTLTLVRVLAIQNNGNITLRKLTNTEAGLTEVCTNSQNWSCGWRVFRDTNGNGDQENTEETLQTFAITESVTVTLSPTKERLTANRWGQLADTSTLGFTISPPVGAVESLSTTLCVNSTGRIRSVQGQVPC